MTNRKWVCAKRSQWFTRRYSADRHIRNLHSGLAKRVRLLDYIIGRISGEYPQADPSLYKNRPPLSPFDNNTNINIGSYRNNPLIHETSEAPFYEKRTQRISSNAQHNRARLASDPWNGISNWLNEDEKTSIRSEPEALDRTPQESLSKLDEIGILLSRYQFPPEYIQGTLTKLHIRIFNNGRDDSFLDEFLTQLQKHRNMIRAYDWISSLNRPS
jgi:hypothetical protein